MMEKIGATPSKLRQLSFVLLRRLQFTERFATVKFYYEDFFGLKDVLEAQNQVIECEKKLIYTQGLRRSAQKDLTEIHRRLSEVRGDLDRTHRGEVGYLELLSKEINCIKEEAELRERLEEKEELERNGNEMTPALTSLSSSLSYSHSRERIQSEKTKWWGLGGSLIGALIGLLAGLSQGRWRRLVTKEDLEILLRKMDQMEVAMGLLGSETLRPILSPLNAAQVLPQHTELRDKEVTVVKDSDNSLKTILTRPRLRSSQALQEDSQDLQVEKSELTEDLFMRKLALATILSLLTGIILGSFIK